MPYGIYTVHQVSGWEGSELMPDFDVFISQNGATYRYLINNAPFNSFIKIVKQDAETGKTIPYAGAGFKIYDPDGNPVTMTFTYPTPTTIDVFYTNAEGSLVTPEKLSFGKGYSIGWEVTVNGEPACIVEANYGLMGICCNVGNNTISAIYHTQGWTLGLVCSSTCLAAWLLLEMSNKRRKATEVK